MTGKENIAMELNDFLDHLNRGEIVTGGSEKSTCIDAVCSYVRLGYFKEIRPALPPRLEAAMYRYPLLSAIAFRIIINEVLYCEVQKAWKDRPECG